MREPRKLIVIGGGEHARVVIEAARTAPGLWHTLGYLDSRKCSETEAALAIERLGDDEAGLRLARGDQAPLFILAVGATADVDGRRHLADRYEAAGARWATVVHERAWVATTARLEAGVFVGAAAAVNAGAWIGPHSIVNTGAIIEHDVRLGAFVHAAPGAVVGGGTRIGEGVRLGLGCRIRDHLDVGPFSLVGMGATVVRDVPEGAVVLGTPARPRGRG